MKINEQEHEKNSEMALQVNSVLPETIQKTEHYKDYLKAEAKYLKLLQRRRLSPFIFPKTKTKENIEIVKLKNSILQKQKIYESYLSRKKQYESWMDEMTIEISSKFNDTLEEAQSITSNVRLQQALGQWENKKETPTNKERIDFYLYLCQEILNNQKYSKKKKF